MTPSPPPPAHPSARRSSTPPSGYRAGAAGESVR